MSTDVETGDFCDEGEIVVVGDQVTTRSVGKAKPISRHMSRPTFHYKYTLFRRRRRHPVDLCNPSSQTTTTQSRDAYDGYDASSEEEYDER